MRSTLSKWYARLGSRSAQVLPVLALVFVVLILFVGLGTDVGLAYVTRAALSKAVDAACLAGIRNHSQGEPKALSVARSTFDANYQMSHVASRQAQPPTVNAAFSQSVNGDIRLDVSATVPINTFFVRVLPAWRQMTVGARAQAMRLRLIMSLVLDRSDSMNFNEGASRLPPAVTTFIDLFDDTADRVAMISFANHAQTDVPLRRPFKADIKQAVNRLRFTGFTASEQGLLKAIDQNASAQDASDDNVLKVIVFFTDGRANTFQHSFACGGTTNALNISPDRALWQPDTGAAVAGCVVPPTIPSIDGSTMVSTSSDPAMRAEGAKRAEAIAHRARAAGNTIYATGMGDPASPVKPIDVDFLQRVANDPASATFDPSQPAGEAVVAPGSAGLEAMFRAIAARISYRLTR